MKAVLASVVASLVGVCAVPALVGCAVSCIEDATGSKCTAKSLKRFDGAAQPVQTLERAPGAPVNIDVLYGSVLVQRSISGKVEVQFSPFVYAGYDEQVSANQQLAQNLRTSATAAGGVTVSVQRAGGTNGLGANTVVRLPDDFDGTLTVVNHGDGPLNEFEVKIEHVGRANALNVTNQSLVGDCWIQGGPSVHSTTVQCGEQISVFDVSDDVNITDSEEMYDDAAPAITLRVAAISPGSHGGKITSTSGAISATFPSAGGFILNAKSPVKGSVQEGALPAKCTRAETSPAAKTITCGAGPTYELTAGAKPEYPVEPKDSNVIIAYQ